MPTKETKRRTKEFTIAPEKNQKNKSSHQRRIKRKQKTQPKLPEKLDPWGAYKNEHQKENRVRLWRPKTKEELNP